MTWLKMDPGKLNAWLPTWGQRSKPTDFRGHLPRLYNFLRTTIKIQNWRGFSLKENGGNAPKWKSEDASLGRDSGTTAGNDALQIRLVTSDLVQRPDCREWFLKMGVSSQVSLLGGRMMKGFSDQTIMTRPSRLCWQLFLHHGRKTHQIVPLNMS